MLRTFCQILPAVGNMRVENAALCESIHDDLRDENESAGILLCEPDTVPEEIANRYPEWRLEIWELARKTLAV